MEQQDIKNRVVGKYELLNEIGRGGMATVYKAVDQSLQRTVAVKILHPHLVTNKEARARFEREARSVAKLKHTSIVEVYDYSETELGEVFLVMELIDGITLREFLDSRESRPIMSEAAALIARKVFIALQIAHNEGIVHRDVKPENILIDKNGNIKLSDFGIAYLAGIGQMTTTGQILGSPAYMSPEQIESSIIDSRADIFSTGTILYEMTVGKLPFTGNSPHQIIKRVVEGYYDNPLSINPSVGDGVSSIIVKCLQIKQELRYGSATEAAEILQKELVKSGITDFDQEQQKCLKDIDSWENNIKPQIIENSLKSGYSARSSHHLPEAMNHLNRVLALDPGNEKALEIVNILSKKRKFKRNIERAATFLSITLILFALVFAVVNSIINSKQDKASISENNIYESKELDDFSINLKKTEDLTKESTGKKIIIIDKNNLDNTDENKKELSAPKKIHRVLRRPVKITKREVIFVPLPMNVIVDIDNKERFTYKISDRSKVLATGRHTVTFIPADNRMEPLKKEFQLTESEDPFTLKARLNWKPGIINITSNTSALVSINGREVGKTNSPITLRVTKGPTENLLILISSKGYNPIQKQIKVTAGETTQTVVNLKKES
ncbi:MAG: serine/threonine protein kinase [Deltaproteobacteria bacterium]|nr:serine/threonine protein kinase [Deltaproteobacteria bacterium]